MPPCPDQTSWETPGTQPRSKSTTGNRSTRKNGRIVVGVNPELSVGNSSGLLQRSLDQRQATLGLFPEQFFPVGEFSLCAVELIRNRQRR